MDVASEASVEAAIDATVAAFGRLDIAVNNSGIGGAHGPSHEMTPEDWRRVFDVNVHGVWLCQRAEIRQMLKQE